MLILTVIQWQKVSTTHLSIWISVLSLTTLITITTYYLIHQIITLKRIKDDAVKPLWRIMERRRVQEMERGSKRGEADGAISNSAAAPIAAPTFTRAPSNEGRAAAAVVDAVLPPAGSITSRQASSSVSSSPSPSSSLLSFAASSALFDSSVVSTSVLRTQLVEWSESDFFSALDVRVCGLTLSVNEGKLWQLFLAAAADIISTLVMLLRDKIIPQ